jgi:hypothetical protein
VTRRRLAVLLAAGTLLAGCADANLPDSTLSGPGWRLLGEGGVGQANTVEVFDTEREYLQRWSVDEDPPAVDYAREVVVRFSPATRDGGKACREARLDDVVIDTSAALVYPTYQDLSPGGCKDTVRAWPFIVALDRAALPPQFRLQVSQNPPGGEIGAGAVLDVDLGG